MESGCLVTLVVCRVFAALNYIINDKTLPGNSKEMSDGNSSGFDV